MRAVAKIDDAQIAKMTLDVTFRATVEEWRAIVKQLNSDWPSWQLANCIRGVLAHVEKSTSTTFTEPMHMADKE